VQVQDLNVQTADAMLEEIQNLKGEERIFIKVSQDVCKKLLYLNLQKKSFRNLFMSYINATTEEANEMNLQKFLDRYTQLHIDEYELTKETTISLLGLPSFQYLTDVLSKHSYYIDMERELLVVHTKEAANMFSGCQCGTTSRI